LLAKYSAKGKAFIIASSSSWLQRVGLRGGIKRSKREKEKKKKRSRKGHCPKVE
jgi:hypothetical protein